LPLSFEKQRGIIQNAFADRRRALAARRHTVAQLRAYRSDAERRLRPSAGNLRDFVAPPAPENFNATLREDLAFAHLLLDCFRQNLHQRQPPRYPAHAAIEPAGQLIKPIVEALLQFPRVTSPPPALSPVRTSAATGPAARPRLRSSATPPLRLCPGPVASSAAIRL